MKQFIRNIERKAEELRSEVETKPGIAGAVGGGIGPEEVIGNEQVENDFSHLEVFCFDVMR
jgi:hypothetical protein